MLHLERNNYSKEINVYLKNEFILHLYSLKTIRKLLKIVYVQKNIKCLNVCLFSSNPLSYFHTCHTQTSADEFIIKK